MSLYAYAAMLEEAADNDHQMEWAGSDDHDDY